MCYEFNLSLIKYQLCFKKLMKLTLKNNKQSLYASNVCLWYCLYTKGLHRPIVGNREKFPNLD